MNEVPPGQEEPDDVDELYRRASALDPSRPSELVRRRVLKNAAQMAAERAAQSDPAGNGAGPAARRRAAKQTWRRPAIFGTLAAAALAGLLIMPQFFAPSAPPTAALSPAQVSRPKSAAAPAPAAPDLTAQTARRSPEAAADEQRQSPALAETQSTLKPHTFARNAAPIADSAAEIAAKNAPAKVQSETHARSEAAAGDSAETARRMQSVISGAGRLSSALPQPAAPGAPRVSDPAAELRRAAEIGDVPELQMLLDKQAPIDARDASGRTALMLATLHGRTQAVDVLLAHGADPNAADAHGTTPLQAAVAGDQRAIAAALQRAGAR